jgi:hypothetical protein
MAGKKGKSGGKREGAGRKTLISHITNYEKGLSLINENILQAIGVLAKGLKSKNEEHRRRCAEALIKKVYADQKNIDFDPSEEGGFQIIVVDKKIKTSKK